MTELLYPLSATLLVSLTSLIGILAIPLRENSLDKILLLLLGFSAGSILGVAFLDLLPEAAEIFGLEGLQSMVLHLTFGFTIFFLLERFIYWYHGHMHGYDSDVDDRMRTKRFVYLNLIGDVIHNLIDGMIITVGFFISISFGIAVTVAVMFHELPQEIGDFGLRRLHQDLGTDV